MQAGFKLPERFGREHVDAVSNVLRDFQQERARFEGFSRDLANEWQQLCDDLASFSSNLRQNELDLQQRDQELETEMRAADESRKHAEELTRQLLATQAELANCREQMDRVQRERSAVRQQIQDVNSGVLSLSELIRIVQSTYTELEQVQAALGQQANELMFSVDGPRLATLPEVAEAEQGACEREPDLTTAAPAADREEQSNWATDEPAEAPAETGHEAEADLIHSDPVIGSVLAELTRLGQQ
jgi:chromosome segregation ATPase